MKSLTEDKLEDKEVIKLLEKVPLTSTGTKEHYKVDYFKLKTVVWLF